MRDGSSSAGIPPSDSASPSKGAGASGAVVSPAPAPKSYVVSRGNAPSPHTLLQSGGGTRGPVTSSTGSDTSPNSIFKPPKVPHRRSANEYTSNWAARFREEQGRWEGGRSVSLDAAGDPSKLPGAVSGAGAAAASGVQAAQAEQFISLGFLLNQEDFADRYCYLM